MVSWRSNRSFALVLGGLAAGGVALIAIPRATLGSGSLRDILVGLGTALLVASVLGATVDQWLKRRLLGDAFETLFGYLLPSVLREELNWLMHQTFVSERFELLLSLQEIPETELLAVGLEIRQDIRNITSARDHGFLPTSDHENSPGR